MQVFPIFAVAALSLSNVYAKGIEAKWSGAGGDVLLSPWQMHHGINANVDDSGWQTNAFDAESDKKCANRTIHGHKCSYSKAVIPPEDSEWLYPPDTKIIGMKRDSMLCKLEEEKEPTCWKYLDFTYFQAFLTIPEHCTVSKFTIDFDGMDDGSQVKVNGVEVEDSYVYLRETGTSDLKDLVKIGKVNRIVITQVDDCCAHNNLEKAVVTLKSNCRMTTCESVPDICNYPRWFKTTNFNDTVCADGVCDDKTCCLPPPECDKQNEYLDKEGNCNTCKEGQKPDHDNLACNSCANGLDINKYTDCNCHDNEVNVNGTCNACPVGQSPADDDEVCVCDNGLDTADDCECGSNEYFKEGVCYACDINIEVPDHDNLVCACANRLDINKYTDCNCYDNEIYVNGTCNACPTGQRPADDDDVCVCNNGLDIADDCACHVDEVYADGTCAKCPAGRSPSSDSSVCECNPTQWSEWSTFSDCSLFPVAGSPNTSLVCTYTNATVVLSTTLLADYEPNASEVYATDRSTQVAITSVTSEACQEMCVAAADDVCKEVGLSTTNFGRTTGNLTSGAAPVAGCDVLEQMCICACVPGDDSNNTAVIAGGVVAGSAMLLAAVGAAYYFRQGQQATEAAATANGMFNDVNNNTNPMFDNPTETNFNPAYNPQ
ncbi:hypothetical protein SARC_05376 [Sphaeroforma arctica JP610]|uniref:Uncharacterized protein n=1 Tax=Sphaeroforma arctica JP610 TaxID=667725 RepID=A0A0L0FZQ7_9EUKA|nr:hypothetical protein SARC_05376 [Sphaeroforma arctica JP610]KNC82337.1 hypothetical protein SARC_05376 [Sphaeroforma arctica JP610]|eukprot:XP_014156239.1 hypothetical protein SARC_05376 [Sphaeroforma arctica JP610]